MTTDDAYLLLTKFFQERNAPRQALSALREGVEIGIKIGATGYREHEAHLECAVFRKGHDIQLERRKPRSPDFTFSLAPETVVVLANGTSDDVGDIGLGIFKEMLTGGVAVQMPGRLISVLRNGYFEVVATGGPQVAAFLAQAGLSSPARIIGFLKSLRKPA
ncbi:MAG: hypothetical protein RBT63_00900 [Bdellovibrionales bacterium]|jgi:hypothetical protein|nr:hypothetical protein [Bdellovibrionales bacterium]